MDKQPEKPVSEWSKEDKLTHRTGLEARRFMESEFGKFFLAVLQSHVDMKRQEYEQPAEPGVDGISQVLRAEANKGAIIGLRLALSLLPGMVSAADALRAAKGLPPSGEDE